PVQFKPGEAGFEQGLQQVVMELLDVDDRFVVRFPSDFVHVDARRLHEMADRAVTKEAVLHADVLVGDQPVFLDHLLQFQKQFFLVHHAHSFTGCLSLSRMCFAVAISVCLSSPNSPASSLSSSDWTQSATTFVKVVSVSDTVAKN